MSDRDRVSSRCYRHLQIEPLEPRRVMSSSGIMLGDFNRDGQVTVADIPAMLTALANLAGYQTAQSLSSAELIQLADVNADGRVDNRDTQGLIALLANQAAPNSPSTWFDTHVQTAAIRTLADTEYQDGVLSRNDMISIFNVVEQAGVVTAQEMADLQAIVNDTSLFGGFDYVQVLSSEVVLGNTANAHYQGATLGNLAVGSGATQLTELVDKWFLGSDHPTGTDDFGNTYSYSQVSGVLFGANGPSYTDVRQGEVGDCYFLAALGEIALQNPTAITNMFIVNGDGTYTVRFFNGSQAQYVTVDQQLPTTSSGTLIFDGMGASAASASNVLWVALAEKAYVQINECGWIRPAGWGGGLNVYTDISSGVAYMPLGQITGQATTAFEMTSGTSSFGKLAAAFGAGKEVCLATDGSTSAPIIGDHEYAVLSVDNAAQTVTLFNPWGINNGNDSGVITLTWQEIQTNFEYFDQTA